MIIDLHVHSKYSHDSIEEPKKIIQECIKKGIDGVCFTEHHSYNASKPVELIDNKEIKIFRGAEVTTNLGHILIFGIKDDKWNNWNGIKGEFINTQKLINYVNEKGGVCILAHPFRKYHAYKNLIKLKGLVAIETNNRKNTMEQTEKSEKLLNEMKLNSVGGSDSHIAQTIGKGYTVFEKKISTIENLVKELKQGNYYGMSEKYY